MDARCGHKSPKGKNVNTVCETLEFINAVHLYHICSVSHQAHLSNFMVRFFEVI